MVDEERIKRLERIAEGIMREAEEEDRREDKKEGEGNRNFVDEKKMEEIKEKIKKYKEGIKERGGRYNETDPGEKFMKHHKGGVRTS